MFRILHRSTQLTGLSIALLGAKCAIAFTAAEQSAPVEHHADCSTYVSVALPAEAENGVVPKGFPGCASYRSYRGIGESVNYSKARACAWQERRAQLAGLRQNPKEPTAWVVGGSLILADIYFNGAGAIRDVPLAMHFACESEAAMAELAMKDLAEPKGSALAHGLFEFCDYAATTLTANFCGGYSSEIRDDRRVRYYRSLKPSMTSEQKSAFEKLLSAQKAYGIAHVSEVDQGGTIRGVRTLGSEEILNDLFHTEVVHFEGKKWPGLSDRQVATADALLRRQYEETLQRLRTRTKEESYEGAVTADHLSDVEGVWGLYRDTWVVFARLRYPAAVAAIRAELTLRRVAFLKTVS